MMENYEHAKWIKHDESNFDATYHLMKQDVAILGELDVATARHQPTNSPQ
jgi:hypothetical protein